VLCVLNTGPTSVPLDAGRLLASSTPLTGGRLPGDSAAWLA
jgi:alpha-glucosidase